MMHNDGGLLFAYIDPGGGEFLLQILLGGVFAWVFRFRKMVFGLRRRSQDGEGRSTTAVDPVIDSAK
jgi:hypothetical protein